MNKAAIKRMHRASMKPWLKIWTHPRETIREIILDADSNIDVILFQVLDVGFDVLDFLVDVCEALIGEIDLVGLFGLELGQVGSEGGNVVGCLGEAIVVGGERVLD